MSLAEAPPALPFGLLKGRRRKMPVRPVIGHADLHQDGDQLYRYWLTRRWMASEPSILWVLLHPQGGTASQDDATIRRIMLWSHRWGYGSLLAVSLYPVCATSSEALLRWRGAAYQASPETGGWQHTVDAAKAAGQMARRMRCNTRVAAWGRLDELGREDLHDWCEQFGAKPPNLCLGVSANGDPLHPSVRGASRPADDAVLVPFQYPLGIGKRNA